MATRDAEIGIKAERTNRDGIYCEMWCDVQRQLLCSRCVMSRWGERVQSQRSEDCGRASGKERREGRGSTRQVEAQDLEGAGALEVTREVMR